MDYFHRKTQQGKASIEGRWTQAAMTRMEGLLIIAIVGLLGLIAKHELKEWRVGSQQETVIYTPFPRETGASADSKTEEAMASTSGDLEEDIEAINAAVAAFERDGGKLEMVSDPEDVIEAMKAPPGHMIKRDWMLSPGLRLVQQSPTDSLSGEPRAFWNPQIRRFEVRHSGRGGIAEFALDPTMEVSARKREGPASDRRTPSLIPVSHTAGNTLGEALSRSSAQSSLPSLKAPRIIYSLVPGRSNTSGDIVLEDANEEGVSTLQYRIDQGDWNEYRGPFSVSVGTISGGADIQARAVPVDTRYGTSTVALRRVSNGSENLPVVVLDEDALRPGLSSLESFARYNEVESSWLMNADDAHEKQSSWLRLWLNFPGAVLTLPGGMIDDEGWFAFDGETNWSPADFAAGKVPGDQLRWVKGVNPMRNSDLEDLVGRTVVAVVCSGEVEKEGTGWNLQNARYGRIKFEVVGVRWQTLPESRESDLFDVEVRVVTP